MATNVHSSYPGLSTLLKGLSKPALQSHINRVGVSQANKNAKLANQHADYVHSKLAQRDGGLDEEPITLTVHTFGPDDLKTPPQQDPEVAIKKFDDWSTDNIKEWLWAEVPVINHDIGYIGTLDKIGITKDDKLVVAEIKLTTKLHVENYVQLAGYFYSTPCLNEIEVENFYFDDAMLLRFDKYSCSWKCTQPGIEILEEAYDVLKGLKALYNLKKLV